MKAFWIYLLIAYLFLGLQAIFFKDIKPDFVLVIVCYVSLKFGRAKGTAYGAFTGLLIDVVNGFLLGPHIIAKTVAAFFIRTLKDNFYEWNLINNTLSILVFAIINIIVISLCLEVFSGVPLMNRSFSISLLEVIYTLVASFILYPIVKPAKEVNGLLR